MAKYIKTSFLQYIKESTSKLNLHPEYIPLLKNELSKFNTDEELLRGGGISIETLDRLAFGFSEDDIKTIHPKELKIKWDLDLENVKHEIKQSGLTPKQWASKVDLSEPIEVSYWEDDDHERGFYIEDGHHRYTAAKILNKELNADLEIKVNPIKVIAPTMSYDEFHRYIFNHYNTLIQESIGEETGEYLTVYHGTKPFNAHYIEKEGLKNNQGYNQGWYMVSTDFESALYHAYSDFEKDVYVFEFRIPIVENDRWLGYPYLWKGVERSDNSTWFALKKPLPKEFIVKVHKVKYTDWLRQKNKGF